MESSESPRKEDGCNLGSNLLGYREILDVVSQSTRPSASPRGKRECALYNLPAGGDLVRTNDDELPVPDNHFLPSPLPSRSIRHVFRLL
jgi:hypothetical protein